MNAAEARDRINIYYGNPLDVVSSCLRGFLIAGPGKKLVAQDFSSIEARVLAWLAGEESVLEIFRTHGKIYEFTASKIYSVPMEEITKHDPRRQVGKVADLALGYQGGVGALQSMCKEYNLKLAPVFNTLWAAATPDNRTGAQNMWEFNFKKTKKSDISREEFLASELTKRAWRDSHPYTENYWKQADLASIAAVREPGKKFSIGPVGRQVTFKCAGAFLWAMLPSGRPLCYPYPRVSESETPWGSHKDTLSYMAQDSTTQQFTRQKAYGGLLTENFTQAVARDALKDAMMRVSTDWDIVLHAHDELVVEVEEKKLYHEALGDIVEILPTWATGLPIKAEGFESRRYRK